MKKIFILLIVLSFQLSAYTMVPVQKVDKFPKGVFKKTWNGNIVQYDNNGHKIHTYKVKNGKITGIK